MIQRLKLEIASKDEQVASLDRAMHELREQITELQHEKEQRSATGSKPTNAFPLSRFFHLLSLAKVVVDLEAFNGNCLKRKMTKRRENGVDGEEGREE